MAKKTQAEREYLKQERRIKQFIRRATKRGFSFPETAIPQRPERVTKRSVQKLQKITPQSLYERATYEEPTTGKLLTGIEGRKQERSRASKKGHKTRNKILTSTLTPSLPVPRGFYGESTGRIKTDEPVSESKQILDNVVEQIQKELENWTPSANWTESLTAVKEKDKNRLSSMFYAKLDEIGEDELAKRLSERASEVNALVAEILYASGSKEGNFKNGRTQVNSDLTRMGDILTGHMLTPEESRALTQETEETLGIETFEQPHIDTHKDYTSEIESLLKDMNKTKYGKIFVIYKDPLLNSITAENAQFVWVLLKQYAETTDVDEAKYLFDKLMRYLHWDLRFAVIE